MRSLTYALIAAAIGGTIFLAFSSSRTVEYADQAKPVYFADTTVNVRAVPSLNAPIIGKLYHGDSVRVESESNGWGRIQHEGKTGFVYLDVLMSSRPPPIERIVDAIEDAGEAAEEWFDEVAESVAESTQNPTIKGKVVGITDGDTLTLLADRKQYRIRLAEIDTPEKGQPWGKQARKALARKVHRKTVAVEVVDTDRYGRLVGKVSLGERDINRELVREGHAWTYRQYLVDRSLLKDEAAAKATAIGLWSKSDPVPPWEWRLGSRSSVNASIDPACGVKMYCGEMTSCKEAKYYLRKCGRLSLDGDGDGVPCESICRR